MPQTNKERESQLIERLKVRRKLEDDKQRALSENAKEAEKAGK